MRRSQSSTPKALSGILILIGLAVGIYLLTHGLYSTVDRHEKGSDRVAAEKAWNDRPQSRPQGATLKRGAATTKLPQLQVSLERLYWDRCRINDCGLLKAEKYPRIYTLKGALLPGNCLRVKSTIGDHAVKASATIGTELTVAIDAAGVFTVCVADPDSAIFSDTALLIWTA